MNSLILAQLTTGAVLAVGLAIAFVFGWAVELIWGDKK